MIVTDDIIKQCYEEFLILKAQYLINKNYYEGQHEILTEYAMQDSRSNLKCVVNYCKRFIDERISYIATNPVNYISKVGKNTDIIDENIGIWEKLHNQELLKQSQIYGKAYELYYFDEYADFKAEVLTPLECYTLESKNITQLAIREYQIKFDTNTYIDVFTKNEILTYNTKDFKLINTVAHRFGEVPVICCKANTECKSLISDIKSLNDAYNNVLSDLVNEVSDFRQCFMTITGAELTEENAVKMKETGLIHIPANGQISYLVKNINDTFVQNLLNELEEKMYKTVSTIDSNEKMQSNTSSLAIRSRLYLLESVCGLIQGHLEQTIRQRLKIFAKTSLKTFDYKDIIIKFTPNIPSDTASIADSISKLRDTVSQKTLLSLLPFIENPELEMKQFKKEQEEDLSNYMTGGAFDDTAGTNTTVQGQTNNKE